MSRLAWLAWDSAEHPVPVCLGDLGGGEPNLGRGPERDDGDLVPCGKCGYQPAEERIDYNHAFRQQLNDCFNNRPGVQFKALQLKMFCCGSWAEIFLAQKSNHIYCIPADCGLLLSD